MKEMTELFNLQHFGQPITIAQMKGICSKGCEKGWFKPDHRPVNYMPIGSERINADGYVEVKVSNTKKPVQRRWRAKHLVIWEKAHGKLPKHHVVIFADRNNRNFALDNLLLVSRPELVVMNRLGLISPHKNLTKTGKVVADLKLAIRKRGAKKKTKRTK